VNGFDSALADLKRSLTQHTLHADLWQSGRAGHLRREHSQLTARLRALAARRPTSSPDVLAAEVARLRSDVEHHQQRVNDLLYDSASMDLGGSE
jgi:hypothetical protein